MYIRYKTEGWGVNHRAQMQSDNIKRTSTLPRGAVTMITKWKWPTLLLQWLSEKVGERKGRQTDRQRENEGGRWQQRDPVFNSGGETGHF